jgi:hypothetical protein
LLAECTSTGECIMAKKEAIVHRSIRYDRTTIDDARGRLEKAAADYWEEEAVEKYYRPNFPAVLLMPLEMARNYHPAIPFNMPITQEQAMAMATVFQWMFTPIGEAAVREVYRRAGWSVSIEAPKVEQLTPA